MKWDKSMLGVSSYKHELSVIVRTTKQEKCFEKERQVLGLENGRIW